MIGAMMLGYSPCFILPIGRTWTVDTVHAANTDQGQSPHTPTQQTWTVLHHEWRESPRGLGVCNQVDRLEMDFADDLSVFSVQVDRRAIRGDEGH